jgi:hypothetical protein
MAAEVFRSRDGIYLVDWALVGRMIRSYVRAQEMLDEHNTKVNTDSHWFGPTLHTVDVNWDAVTKNTTFKSEAQLRDFYCNAKRSMRSQINLLKCWNRETAKLNDKFQAQMRDAQHQTMANIGSSVSHFGTAIKVAQVTRDFSAEFIMVGATYLTGGAAAWALPSVGAAAGLKTWARAQDDPKASGVQLAVHFATEFALGGLDLGAGKLIKSIAENAGKRAAINALGGDTLKKAAEHAAQKGTEVALGILWTHAKGFGGETTKSYLQTGSFKKAAVTGGLKVAGGIHSKILETLLPERFQKTIALADTTISFGMDKLTDLTTEPREAEERKQPPQIYRPIAHEHHLDAICMPRDVVDAYVVRQIGSAGP